MSANPPDEFLLGKKVLKIDGALKSGSFQLMIREFSGKILMDFVLSVAVKTVMLTNDYKVRLRFPLKKYH